MSTRPPTLTRILIAIGFSLSCFGLFLFLWIAFGGPLPLSSKGYEFTVPFKEATQLADQSDVRISGVSVGKVASIALGDDGLAHAVIELDSRFAPIPSNTKAILRQKTLLGETYVELTPGSDTAPPLPEGGALPRAQVSNAVQLDEIFRTFNPQTRAAFQGWMQNAAVALHNRGPDLSAALGELPSFADSANRVLRVLDTQGQAVRQLVRDGGEVFRALSERQGQLRGLVQNAATVFDTTARRNQDLASTFQILPTFLDESRATLSRLASFSTLADPLVQQLRPAAEQLSPTLVATGKLAPDLETFFRGLRGTIAAGPRGLGALRHLLGQDLTPVLRQLGPSLAQLNPILQVLRIYRHEITAFLGNTAAASNGFSAVPETNFKKTRYLRIINPMTPETVAVYANRLKSSRTNPYVQPLGYRKLKHSLDSFETRQCTSGIAADLDPNTPNDPNFNIRTGGSIPQAQDFFNRIVQFLFDGGLSTNVPAPPCKEQAPFHSIGVSPELSQYLHVRRAP